MQVLKSNDLKPIDGYCRKQSLHTVLKKGQALVTKVEIYQKNHMIEQTLGKTLSRTWRARLEFQPAYPRNTISA